MTARGILSKHDTKKIGGDKMKGVQGLALRQAKYRVERYKRSPMPQVLCDHDRELLFLWFKREIEDVSIAEFLISPAEAKQGAIDHMTAIKGPLYGQAYKDWRENRSTKL